MTTNTEPDEGGVEIVHWADHPGEHVSDPQCPCGPVAYPVGHLSDVLVDCAAPSDVLTETPAQVAESGAPAAPGATESASGSPSAWEVLSEAERALWDSARVALAAIVDAVDRLADGFTDAAVERHSARAETERLAAKLDVLWGEVRRLSVVADEVDSLAAVRDAARSTAALLEADGARLRERLADLAARWEGLADEWRARDKGYAEGLDQASTDLRALLAPEGDAPAAAWCEDCEHSGHLPGGCEDYSDEPPDGGPCECMTDSTALRALLTEGGEG